MTHRLCSLTSCSSGPHLFYKGLGNLCRVKPELFLGWSRASTGCSNAQRAPQHSQQGCHQQREWRLCCLCPCLCTACTLSHSLLVPLLKHCLHPATLSA